MSRFYVELTVAGEFEADSEEDAFSAAIEDLMHRFEMEIADSEVRRLDDD